MKHSHVFALGMLTSLSLAAAGNITARVLAGIPGDANSDGKVNFADQTAVLSNFGAVAAPIQQAFMLRWTLLSMVLIQMQSQGS